MLLMFKQTAALLAACLLMLPSARAESVLRTQRYKPYETFTAAHPEVTVDVGEDYLEPDQLLAMLMTRSMDVDVFYMFSNGVNLASMIDKGYLLDLSGNEAIREAVSRMYPALIDYVARDGAIYAVPYSVGFEMQLMCNEPVWTELGYTLEDVPKTFPALLDFLEGWVIRCESEDLRYCVINTWDETLYDECSYPKMLVQLLMDSWVQQKEYAGEPMRFNDPVLIGLLQRAMQVGSDIYRDCEPRKAGGSKDGPALFQSANPYLKGTWAKMDDWMIGMRITPEQPTLMPGTVHLLSAYSGTGEPELAAEMIAAELQRLDDKAARVGTRDVCFLYTDAQPLPNPRQAGELRNTRNYIAIAEHRLAGDDTPLEDYLELEDSDYARPKEYDDYTAIGAYRDFAASLRDMLDRDVEDKLVELRATLEWHMENAWDFPPEDLTVYQQFAQNMLIGTPGVFRSGSDARSNYNDLISQYVHRLITADQLVFQLDRIAQMAELENQ